MAHLDIATPKGALTVKQSRAAVLAFERTCPSFMYVQTPEISDAVNDGIIVNRATKTIASVVEVKCRGNTLEQLKAWNYEWLVTADKVRRNAELAKAMRVSLTAFVFLVPSRILLLKKLYEGASDKWLVELNSRNTVTQKTVNGGQIVRENAYIDVHDAVQITVTESF